MASLDSIDLELKKRIAKRIADLREATGKKQSEFAKESLKDRQTLHRWEKGRGATIYTINKICIELEISLDDFFNDPLFKKK